MLRRALERGLCSLGRSGIYQRLPDTHDVVLVYHSVGGGGYDDIPPELLRAQVEWLRETYEIVDLPAVLEESDEKRSHSPSTTGSDPFGRTFCRSSTSTRSRRPRSSSGPRSVTRRVCDSSAGSDS